MSDVYSFLADHVSREALIAFGQVVLIDLVLAGDNAIVIGLAAAGLQKEQRARAIIIGIAAATVMRIGFALITTQLLQIVGLLMAGGILLLWVCWKMWRELRSPHLAAHDAEEALHEHEHDLDAGGTVAGKKVAPKKTLGQAVLQILVADITMSLDNVLAVAGAAYEHPWVLVSGLVLSIALMGIAASYIASLLNRQRWIAYVGLAIILYVALDMIYRGSLQLWPVVSHLAGG